MKQERIEIRQEINGKKIKMKSPKSRRRDIDGKQENLAGLRHLIGAAIQATTFGGGC
jgi:hypothetical protein